MSRYVVIFCLVVAFCVAAEFAGWHVRNTPGDVWKHAVRGPLMLALAWGILRIFGLAKGV